MLVNILVKILGTDNWIREGLDLQKYNAPELVLSRSIVSFAISAFLVKRKKLPFFGNNKKWLLIRGFAGVVGLSLFFFTINKLPLALASILQYLSPIFTVLFAVFILKERVFKLQWLFILFAFLGIVILGYSNLAGHLNFDMTWFTLGLVSAFFSSVAYLAIVKLKPTDEPITIVLYFPMIATPIMLVWCIFDHVWPQGWEWLMLLGIGIFTQIAQIFMTRALHESDTSLVVPFQYLGAIYAFLIGLFIFDEQLSYILDLALALIILSIIGNALVRHIMLKKERKNEN